MNDATLMDRASLDKESAVKFKHEWLVETEDGVFEFETEAEACAFQRGWRIALGIDPETGKIIE